MSMEHPNWGGARRGAGRKKSIYKRHDPPHRARPSLSPKHPVHVTLRVRDDVPRLRTGKMYQVIRRVLAGFLGRDDLRVVHASIQHNHLHFLVEARDRRALSRGMQSLEIRLARAINQALDRVGKLFAFRYHARAITSTWQARRAICYVLNNWRKHREDLKSPRAMAAPLDPYASGLAFDGWVGAPRFAVPPGYEPLEVSPPRTYLLRHGWTRHGRIELFETPGPLR
jgi:REP element-mobilizing transposase RayT